jgi:hypothetical protein
LCRSGSVFNRNTDIPFIAFSQAFDGAKVCGLHLALLAVKPVMMIRNPFLKGPKKTGFKLEANERLPGFTISSTTSNSHQVDRVQMVAYKAMERKRGQNQINQNLSRVDRLLP